LVAARQWLQGSDHYGWLSGYLHARGMGCATRVMMASISASMALSLVALVVSSDGPRGAVPVAMTGVAFLGGVAGTILWASRWPTRPQSVLFALASNASIALACLAHPVPLAALLGCVAFATSGAYIAFFHTTRFVLYNFGVAAVVGVIEAIRLVASGSVALAGVDLWLVLQINIALPFAIQWLVRALGVDLLRADRDPLTSLLNRRAFQHKVLGLLAGRRTGDTYLVVALVDLDNFKALNDNHGHSAGDRALVHVARALETATRNTAIIARSGGEEFVIADTMSSKDPTQRAQQICDAIAALPVRVTASVGTACAPLGDVHDDRGRQPLIEQLVAAADAAMYHAKRSGGNRTHHHSTSDPDSGVTSSAQSRDLRQD
jgi:diguanylate cyclase (GGDEF)-like protein